MMISLFSLFRFVRAGAVAFAIAGAVIADGAVNALSPVAAQTQSPVAPAAPAEPRALLDEKLSLWEPFLGVPQPGVEVPGYDRASRKPIGLRDPKNVFSVRIENGEPVLRVTGEIMAGLTTREEFANYRLRFQFRFCEKRWKPRLNAPRDNGILYHCVGGHGAFAGAWMRSVEYQIQENDVGDFFPLCGSGADFPARADTDEKGKKTLRYAAGAPLVASGARVMRGTDYNERPLGEWNDGELVVVGADSVHILNGRVVNELRNIRYVTGKGDARRVVPLTKGKLQIQSEYAEVEFRRIFIEPATQLPATGKPRVLVFSKTNGFRHTDAIDAGKKFFAKMGEVHGFSPTFSEDAAVFSDESLRRFDAIVLLCTAGEFTMDLPAAGKRASAAEWDAARKTSAERREAFRRAIAAGTALVGLHAATDNFKVGGAISKDGGTWDEYARIIGGAFQHHPAHQNAIIKITDKTHAATRHLDGAGAAGDGTWRVFDEWYDFKQLQRDNHVILDLDDTSLRGVKPCLYEDGNRAGTHPLAWTRTYGNARVFYTARGHYGAAFGEPAYAQHVIAGLFWALNRPIPKVEPATLPPVKPLPAPKPARKRR